MLQLGLLFGQLGTKFKIKEAIASLPVRSGLVAPLVRLRGLACVDGHGVSSAVLIDRGGSVPDPLTPAVHWYPDEELDFGHLERTGVLVAQKVADQRSVVRNFLRAGSVAYSGRLDDCRIAAHRVDQADESIV